ncbi:MAG: hypothetical protein DI605_15825 [Sphingomonas sp.]|nr:MAG: hypothetical protein DI605_15825 [Sphingomonas sp.]
MSPQEAAILAIGMPAARPAAVSLLKQRVRDTSLPFLYASSAVRHWRALSDLWRARDGSLLAEMVAARPEIWTMLRVRFVSARWNASERLKAIAHHCDIAERLGLPFNIHPHRAATLLRLDGLGPDVRLVLDSPRWLLREGLLALSLMDGCDRIFSLSFTLAQERGRRVAYIGGIQGRRAPDALARNRELTHLADGARPQDLLFELFRALCRAAGVAQILAVSGAIRNDQTTFARYDGYEESPVTFDYDALWSERGGALRADGFFALAIDPEPRDESTMPAKRRAARRKKMAFIAAAQDRLTVALSRPRGIETDRVELA